MKRLLTLTATILALSGCSTLGTNDRLKQSIVADIVTTELAIGNGGVEGNPLGVAGVAVGKIALYHVADGIGGETGQSLKTYVPPVLEGASFNNTMLAMGVKSTLALPLGVCWGLLVASGAQFGPVTVNYDNPN